MKKLHNVEYTYDPSTGTSHHNLLVIASFRDLCDILGNPSIVGSGDEKVQLTWVLFDKENSEIAITIYDYKKRTSIYNIYEWNIGSKGLDEDEVIQALDGFDIKGNIRKVVITNGEITKEKVI